MNGRFGKLAPGTRIGGEDAERLTLAGKDLVTLVNGYVFERVDRSTQRLSRSGDSLFYLAAERIGIAIVENSFSAGLGKQLSKFHIGEALANDKATAELF